MQSGGRFVAEQRAEPGVELAQEDAYGFPTVLCTSCGGTGRSARYNTVSRSSRCYVCSGTGRAYERGLVQDAVREFCAARLSATRPQVRQLRVGDTVSLKYEDLRTAEWHKVAGVLVYPNRPTRFSPGERAQRHPVAYAAMVELDDGTAIMTTTDTTVARRGADIDPTPYVERARAGAVAQIA